MSSLVTFGKYKGQSWAALFADDKYVQWCNDQPGLRVKLAAAQTAAPAHSPAAPFNPLANAPTPAHNRLQNMFLDESFKNAFANALRGGAWVVGCSFEEADGTDVELAVDHDNFKNSAIVVKVEIKPQVGDDYPRVLREIKGRRESEERRWALQEQQRHMPKTLHQQTGRWVLFIERFDSDATTLSQLKAICQQEAITLIMLSDFWPPASQLKKWDIRGLSTEQLAIVLKQLPDLQELVKAA